MLCFVLCRAAATRQQWALRRTITAAASRQADLINWVKDNEGTVASTVSISYPNAVTGAGLHAMQVHLLLAGMPAFRNGLQWIYISKAYENTLMGTYAFIIAGLQSRRAPGAPPSAVPTDIWKGDQP
jgi:hypothetical protein